MMVILTQNGSSFLASRPDADRLRSKGFGEMLESGNLFSLYEAVFLVEKGKAEVRDQKGQIVALERLCSRRDFKRLEYFVYADLRSKGYVVRSGLKYGVAFRVYEKGVKPGEDHALWLVIPLNERRSLSVREIAGKNRVAHSTRKRLLFAVVDDEGSITYLENIWRRL